MATEKTKIVKPTNGNPTFINKGGIRLLIIKDNRGFEFSVGSSRGTHLVHNDTDYDAGLAYIRKIITVFKDY